MLRRKRGTSGGVVSRTLFEESAIFIHLLAILRAPNQAVPDLVERADQFCRTSTAAQLNLETSSRCFAIRQVSHVTHPSSVSRPELVRGHSNTSSKEKEESDTVFTLTANAT